MINGWEDLPGGHMSKYGLCQKLLMGSGWGQRGRSEG